MKIPNIPVGTKLKWKDENLRYKYGVMVKGLSADRKRITIQWTALEDNVEGHDEGYKWTTDWDAHSIERQLDIIKNNHFADELFEL